MLGFLAVPTILQKLMSSTGAGGTSYGGMKHLLVAMLETFEYERMVLRTATEIVKTDLVYYAYRRQWYVGPCPCAVVPCWPFVQLMISNPNRQPQSWL